jgi:Flp pilus assembly pilin Flp
MPVRGAFRSSGTTLAWPERIMLKATFEALRKDTRGASFMEYVVLVGLIAVVCIGAYSIFGKAVSDKVQEFGGTVGTIPGK